MMSKTEKITPFTTEELGTTIDNISCGFITIQKFMDYMKDILDEDSKQFVTELSQELEGTIESIAEVL